MVLPDWFWRLAGPRLVNSYDPRNVNPHSYDLTLDNEILLQRYRGHEYDNVKAYVFREPFGAMGMMISDGFRFAHNNRSVAMEPFAPGDSVLGTTEENLRVPRWLRLQGQLKSSVAREGLNHRTALYIDAGFEGQITLELQFDRTGHLIPYLPIIQVEAQPVLFPTRSYRKTGRYGGQVGVTPNRNFDIAFAARSPVETP